MADEHWPGNLAPRKWAALARDAENPEYWVENNVPPELQEWVYEYLGNPELSPDDWV